MSAVKIHHFMSMFVLSMAVAASLAAQSGAASASGAAAKPAARRLALVVGNGAYTASPLKNPPNDAEDVAAALTTAGFQTTVLKDADLSAFDKAVADFATASRGADTALFYYAGHGVQIDGMNFLLPVSPKIDDAAGVKARAVAVDTVVAKLEASGVRTALIFLDSCRDNPFPGASRSAGRGLAVVPTPRTVNSLIAYATSPGDTAADGSGRNGVFSGAFIDTLKQPGLELGELMRQVKAAVSEATAGKQQPRVDDGMKERFYFVSPDLAAAQARLQADAAAAELAALETQIAEREMAIAAAKDAKVKQELEIAQQKAKALENIKRLATEAAKDAADRAAAEAARQVAEDAVRGRLDVEAAATAAALKREAEAKRAAYESLGRADDSLEEHLRVLATLESTLGEITERYAAALTGMDRNTRLFYTAKAAELERLGQDPWESDAEYTARRAAETVALDGERDRELARNRLKLEAERYVDSLDLRTRLLQAEADFAERRWSLRGKQLALTYGAFDRDKKGWPVAVEAQVPGLSYKADLFHDLSQAPDLRTAFTAADTALKAGAYAAELDFSYAKRSGTDLFVALVNAVRVVDVTSGAVVLSRDADQKWYAFRAGESDRKIFGGSLVVTSDPSGAAVILDGQRAGIAPLTLAVAAGVHTIKLELAGQNFRGERTVVVDFGQTVTVAEKAALLALTAVEGGSFQRGSSTVTVSSFKIGTYEVTQAEYQAIMGTNPANFKGDTKRPVEQVTWYDAVTFCNALSAKEGRTPAYTINGTTVTWNKDADGYRLPTEAEWEYAARGGRLSKNYEYAGSADVNAVGWYLSNSGNTTHTVGTKAANELGIYDMSGNVWEWCWDWVGDYPAGTQTDPTGLSSGTQRVLRGGGYSGTAENLRSAYRHWDAPANPYMSLGFRVLLPMSGQ